MPQPVPTALVGLLFAIVVMFSMQGRKILAAPLDVPPFTAVGNGFELAMTVAVETFGVASQESLIAVIDPLIGAPALVGF